MTPEENSAEQDEALANLRALPKPVMDFTTPEGAILCLEDAYRRKDIEAAVACKDFLIEATLMLADAAPEAADDPEVLAQAAEVLEQAFRKEKAESWPDMAGVESFFVGREELDPNFVVINEFNRFPDGTFSEVYLQVALTESGWRVLGLCDVEDDEDETTDEENNE